MSLVVDDEYIESVKNYIATQCDTLDYVIQWYVKTMRKVIETGIMEGETAKAIKKFLSLVEIELDKEIITPALLKTRAERFCSDFIWAIDDEGEELY